MTTFVALLRAVNVSGQNRIPMAELRRALSGLGRAGVQTYLQSGNVVFDAPGDDPVEQAAALHELIARELGHDVGVLALTAAEMQRVAAEMPFVGAADFEGNWVHATFVSAPVDEAGFAGLKIPARPGEKAVLCLLYTSPSPRD